MKPDREKFLKSCEFRPLVRGDLGPLAALVLGMKSYSAESFWLKTIDARYYEWMYFDNPVGDAFTYAAFYEGKLIASFAISPRKFHLSGQDVSAGKTMDMFTDPDYQGLGLMSALTGACYKSAANSGIDMFYVTPSDNSYPIFLNKFRYEEPFRVNYRVKPLSPAPLLKRTGFGSSMAKLASGVVNSTVSSTFTILNRGRFRGYEFEECAGFDESFNALWAQCGKPGAGLRRDTAYLTWRYSSHPDAYKVIKMLKQDSLEGFVVLKITRRRGYKTGEIVDFNFMRDNDGAFHTAMLYATDLLRKEGCLMTQAWSIENGRHDRQFARAGFRFKRKKLHFLLSPGCEDAAFYDPFSWHLTQGDGNDL